MSDRSTTLHIAFTRPQRAIGTQRPAGPRPSLGVACPRRGPQGPRVNKVKTIRSEATCRFVDMNIQSCLWSLLSWISNRLQNTGISKSCETQLHPNLLTDWYDALVGISPRTTQPITTNRQCPVCCWHTTPRECECTHWYY